MGHHLSPVRDSNLISFTAQQACLEGLDLVYIYSSLQIKLKPGLRIWRKKLNNLTFDLNR